MRTCVALHESSGANQLMMIIEIGPGRVALIDQDGGWEQDWEESEDFTYAEGWEVFE